MGLLLLILCSAASSVARPWARARFAHLGVEDGLSNSFVMAIDQDRDGLLWISTQDGLNRYDGYDFTAFQLDPEDTDTVSGNWIDSTVEDATGNRWVILGVGGLEYFDRATGVFHYFQHQPDDSASLPGPEVTDVTVAPDGTAWVGTGQGVARISADRSEVRRFDDPDGLLSSRTMATLVASDGTVWIATARGVARGEGEAFTPVAALAEEVVAILEDQMGQLWFLAATGDVHHLDPSTETVVRTLGSNADGEAGPLLGCTDPDAGGRVWMIFETGAPLRFDPRFAQIEDPLANHREQLPTVRSLLTDRGGRTWIGTRGFGLFLLEEEDDRLTRFTASPTNPASLAGDVVWNLFEDRAGLIWISCFGSGISVLDPNNQEFVNVHHDPGVENTLPDQPVTSFAEGPPGKLWVGSDFGGLYCYDQDTDELVIVPVDAKTPGMLPTNTVLSLHVDDELTLWVGTKRGLVYTSLRDLPNLEFKQLRHDDDDPTALPVRWVTQIVPSHDGRLWLGHADVGLTRFDPRTGAVDRYPAVADLRQNSSVWALAEGHDGRLWLGFPVVGLWRMDPSDGSLVHFAWDPADPTAINNRTVNSLLVDSRNRLWVGTYSGGLDLYNPADNTFQHLTRRDGLPSNMINGIVEDADGTLWLATNRGVCSFDPDTRRVQSFGLQDGLQGLEFTRGAAFVDSEGAVLLGGIHGFNRFHPTRLRTNQHVPPVILTSCKRFDEEVLPPRTQADQSVVLSHRDRYLSLTFAALDFANPAKNRYRYKMDGLDDHWIESGSRRLATYSHMPPGEYTFRVQGSNNDGVWNRDGAALRVVVTPPFWQRTWFRAATLSALLTTIWLVFHWRVRRVTAENRRLEHRVSEATAELLEKNEQLEVLNEEKSELVRIAAHDMRTPLTSIVGYLGLTIDGLNQGTVDPPTAVSDLSQARAATQRVADLLSGMLDISAIEAGKLTLELQRCSMHDLLAERSQFHRRMAEKKGIELLIEADPDCPPVALDRGRIGDVVDNLLSNAIKYTFPGGRVQLSQVQRQDDVLVEVTDTGQGLDESDLQKAFRSFQRLSAQPTGGEPSTGLGLAIVKKIVELHGGAVGVHSRKGHGSTFFFTLPLDAAVQPAGLA